jgi:hypothetical protein
MLGVLSIIDAFKFDAISVGVKSTHHNTKRHKDGQAKGRAGSTGLGSLDATYC